MPGTKKNRNALTSGRRSYLTSGRLPRGASYVSRIAGEFRRALEAAVAEAYGDVSLARAALILSAVRHETRAVLTARWLRIEHDRLSLPERLSLLKEIGSASDSRDRCIAALKLDRDAGEKLTGLLGLLDAASVPAGPSAEPVAPEAPTTPEAAPQTATQS